MAPRKEVEQVLEGIDFPATKQQLVERAKRFNASQEVLEAFQNMYKAEYDTKSSVFHELGEEAGESAA